MLNQLCYLGYSDNRFKMGLEFESLAWYICMFTYLLIFLKFFFVYSPNPPCIPLVVHIPHFMKHWAGLSSNPIQNSRVQGMVQRNMEFKEEKRTSQWHWEFLEKSCSGIAKEMNFRLSGTIQLTSSTWTDRALTQ